MSQRLDEIRLLPAAPDTDEVHANHETDYQKRYGVWSEYFGPGSTDSDTDKEHCPFQ
jgi:hypothetical protein